MEDIYIMSQKVGILSILFYLAVVSHAIDFFNSQTLTDHSNSIISVGVSADK